MVEIIIMAAAVAAALVFSGIAVSYRRFSTARARLLEYAKTAAPEMTVVELTDVGMVVQVLGAEVAVDLATLLRQRRRPGSERAWFEQVLAGVRTQLPLPDVPPLALVRDRILPQLKRVEHADLFARYPAAHHLAWRPFARDVVITYVIRGLYQFTAVTEHARQAWGMTPEALHDLAMDNLRTVTEHLLAEMGGPRMRYEHLDGLDATRILAADLIVPRDETDPVIAIPEETVLWMAPTSQRSTLAAETALRYEATPRPLSPRLFRLSPGGAGVEESDDL